MTEIRQLPLFPLPTVVFPGQALPLHIFEPRYRRLIAHCRETAAGGTHGEGRFVVVLSDGPHLFTVGCAVEISRIATEYPDGRLDIVTRGVQRVRIHRLLQNDPFSLAEVEELTDVDQIGLDAKLREHVLALATRLTEEICEQPILLAVPPEDSAAYRLAGLTDLDLAQRQHLLEELDENRRLVIVRDALQRSLARMFEARPGRAAPGGYIH